MDIAGNLQGSILPQIELAEKGAGSDTYTHTCVYVSALAAKRAQNSAPL